MRSHRYVAPIAMLCTLLLHGIATAATANTSSDGPAAIIPLHGFVGVEIADPPSATSFDAKLLDAMLRAARDEGANAVVLDIDSSGGLAEQSLPMLEVLQHFQGKLKILAYVRNAEGPAALVALACNELIIEPAAVFRTPVFARNAHDRDRVRIRALLEAAGLDQAMAEGAVEGTLWCDPSSGQLSVARPTTSRSDWIKLSGGPQLVLTAQRLTEIGIATEASHPDRVEDNFTDVQTIDITRQLRRLARRRADAVRMLASAHADAEECLNKLADVIAGFNSSSTSATSRQQYGRLRSTLLRSLRSMNAISQNARAPMAPPASILCKLNVIEQAVDSLPTDTREFGNAQTRGNTTRLINDAKAAWADCESP